MCFNFLNDEGEMCFGNLTGAQRSIICQLLKSINYFKLLNKKREKWGIIWIFIFPIQKLNKPMKAVQIDQLFTELNPSNWISERVQIRRPKTKTKTIYGIKVRVHPKLWPWVPILQIHKVWVILSTITYFCLYYNNNILFYSSG